MLAVMVASGARSSDHKGSLVQKSMDAIPFCLSFIDLMESTTVAESKFQNLTTTILKIKYVSRIYAFSLTWNEIKTLTRKFRF